MPVPDSIFREPGAARTALNIAPNPPFLLRVHPDLWDLVSIEVDGKSQSVLVPQVAKDVLAPGVNGVWAADQDHKGEDCYRGLMSRQIGKGWRYLDGDLTIDAAYLPSGVKAGPLVREATTINGGTYHYEAFEAQVSDPLNGSVRLVYHREGLFRWLHECVQAGVFGQPTEYALNRVRDQITLRRSEFASSRAMPPEVRAERIAEIDGRVKALDKAATVARSKPTKREVAHA